MTAKPDSQPPNVLLISVDQWPGQRLGCAGNRFVMTPTIDRLALNGKHFPNAISACPVCVAARRGLMTGLSPRGHGDRYWQKTPRMPEEVTLAQCFRDAGYQTFGVGKLHVFPPRDRIGFDDVSSNEEGRRHGDSGADDWEMFLAEQGFGGMAYAAGGTNNDYNVAPWHLPDACHPTNWSAREMCRTIRRRNPEQPGFWYLSFTAPHPPLWPLSSYLEQYLNLPVDEPVTGNWVRDFPSQAPSKIRYRSTSHSMSQASPEIVQLARRAFYAMMTHIDHQIRVVLGTLREAGLLDRTIVAFVSDHGEMLGDHGLWGKSLMYEGSVGVPFLIVPPPTLDCVARGEPDSRLVELRDMMPSLLDLAGIPVPTDVEGISVFSDERRKHIYGEHGEGIAATRMVRDQRFKLIYYPEGNTFQLFDLLEDPKEIHDLSSDPRHATSMSNLQDLLAGELYGGDGDWLVDGSWKGIPANNEPPPPNYEMSAQRGIRFP